MHKHELLAPAGSLEIAKAVMDAGADAVYLAGGYFGARAYASNLSDDDLVEVLDYAHLRGKKIHLTVNTLLKNRELEETLFSFIRPVYERGLDAVIVQDFGVLSFLHRNFPWLALHASTQMSVASKYGAEFLKKSGVERIVTARELTLSEIKAIKEQTGMEVESFIHGALCYCYSGQCLMSSLFGGRSGNRGRCAQPCRLPWDIYDQKGKKRGDGARYPLSPKDLCALDLLPSLCDAGIDSFKIEGRMKQVEYAAGVTAVYRHYLDFYEQDPSSWHVEQADRERLLGLGNRSGFTKGYYQKPWGRHMLSDMDSSHSAGKPADVAKDAASENLSESAKPPVSMLIELCPGEPVRLGLCCGEHSVTVNGDVVQKADKRPLDPAEIKKRLAKTGESAFRADEITVHMEDDCFLPVSVINGIRRDGLDQLLKKVLADWYRVCDHTEPVFAKEDFNQSIEHGTGLVVQITKENMLSEVFAQITPDEIDLDLGTYDETVVCRLTETIRKHGSRVGLCLPYCLRGIAADPWEKLIKSADFDQFLARSYDGLGFLLSNGVAPEKIRIDAGVYVFSRETAASFAEHGIRQYTMSYELNGKELRHQEKRGAMLSVYGRIPLMISAQCVYRNYIGCRKQKDGANSTDLYLEDRYGNRFFVDARCEDCYNIIYNQKPQYLLDRRKDISEIRPACIRISFTTESEKEIRKILKSYRAGEGRFDDRYTRGHFNRGVE